MAKFSFEMPKEILKDIQKIEENTDEIFGEVVKAGADVVYKNILNNMPSGVRNSNLKNCLKTTEPYKTPSDRGINCKVAFYGWFENENGQTVPASLVASVFEYGRSKGDFPKQPFVRKSFNKSLIEQTMLDKQREITGGLLE